MWPHLDERQRRLFAATNAVSLGHGGIKAVSEICGLSRAAISKGIRELGRPPVKDGKITHPGSGRPSPKPSAPGLKPASGSISRPPGGRDSVGTGSGARPVLRKTAGRSAAPGRSIGGRKAGAVSDASGSRIQPDMEARVEKRNQDSDRQYQFVNDQAGLAIKEGQPVIAIETKLSGPASSRRDPGAARSKPVVPESSCLELYGPLSSVAKHGVFGLDEDEGHVSVTLDQEIATFAVSSILGWWERIGNERFPRPKYLLVVADGRGPGGFEDESWTDELQRLADTLEVPVKVRLFPNHGYRKWNNDHRLFSFVSSGRKRQEARDCVTTVSLISRTYAVEGLKVNCRLDRSLFKPHVKSSGGRKASVVVDRDTFNGKQNYTFHNRNS
ncbi:MAG: ISAzo13 family transposase [Deltaproteobacteria bacterium]|nr:ISAzo13 family transposase [Deltaproteobacteria bacterium]